MSCVHGHEVEHVRQATTQGFLGEDEHWTILPMFLEESLHIDGADTAILAEEEQGASVVASHVHEELSLLDEAEVALVGAEVARRLLLMELDVLTETLLVDGDSRAMRAHPLVVTHSMSLEFRSRLEGVAASSTHVHEARRGQSHRLYIDDSSLVSMAEGVFREGRCSQERG